MKKSLYICVGKQLIALYQTYISIPHIAYPLVSNDISLGCLPKQIKGVRSLFVHTQRKTC